jgi:flagellar protein FlaJ
MSTDAINESDAVPGKEPDEDIPKITGDIGQGFVQRLLYACSPWSYPLYTRFISHRRRFVEDVENRLRAAHIDLSVEVYLAGALGIGALTGIITGIGIGLAFLLFIAPLPALGPGFTPSFLDPVFDIWLAIRTPVLAFLLLALGAIIGVVSALFAAKQAPNLRIYQRKREINLVLPNAVAFMYAQSDGGMGQLELIEAVADAEDTLGEVAVEFRRIQHQMTYFNEDYRAAIEKAAEETPSDALSQFLNDMLSVINSGGNMTEFLDGEKEKQMQLIEQSQTSRLQLIESLGQLYLGLAVGPLFALVIVMLISLLGSPKPGILAAIVYGVIPLVNLLYLSLLDTVKKDKIGTGILKDDSTKTDRDTDISPFDLGVVDEFADEHPDSPMFSRIRQYELRHRISKFLADPLYIFQTDPKSTLYVTVPVAGITVLVLYALGILGPSISTLQADGIGSIVTTLENEPIKQTTGWVVLPSFIVMIPFSWYYERKVRHQDRITETLTADLRKMSNANEAGQTVLEAIKTAGEGNSSLLTDELERVYKKVDYGYSLSAGLIEMNNKYQRPRLARSVKLIERAQQASNEISDVLKTATDLSEIRDRMEDEYSSRMQTQLVVLTVTFLVTVGVLGFLRVFFVPTITDLVTTSDSAGEFLGGGGGLTLEFINLLYFHAAVLQGAMTGLVIGYINTEDILRSVKYVIAFVTVSIIIWGIVTVLG